MSNTPADIHVRIHEGPLPPTESPSPVGAGAVNTFEGVVRPMEEERLLDALVYQHYDPMTKRELERLAESIVGEYGLSALHVHHSIGVVPVNRPSFRLHIASPHRAAALAATERFIIEMKRDVPLWKIPRYADEAGPAA